jgi:hypothetical protein
MNKYCKIRTLAVALAVSMQIAATPGCGGHRVPDLSQVFSEARQQTGKRPIIIVPGILNMTLVNSETRETVWPSVFRSGDDEIALPINGDPLNSRDNLVPTKAIESARFLPLTPRVKILGDLLESLRNHAGYREGNWENPAPDGDRDTFYTFVYDWRRDNVQIAHQLIERIGLLKTKLNKPELRFNIIAISMGGLIARYAAMYGADDLPANGIAPVVSWAGAAHIEKILMFGVPNEGSMEAFATVLNGYSITEGANKPRRLFHKLSREDAFTGMAVFELMPHRQTVKFLDQDLKPLQIDLYDPANWKLYGWSIAHDPEFRKRFAKTSVLHDTSNSHSAGYVLEAHLSATLERTRLFHQALDAPLEGPSPVSLLAFAGDCDETLNAPVLYFDKKRNRWVTVTSPQDLRDSEGRKINREEVKRAMYLPGDGRVTRASVLGENIARTNAQSPNRGALPIAHAFFACGGHGSLHNNRILQDNALSVLVRTVVQ